MTGFNAREFGKFAEVVLALRDTTITKKMLKELVDKTHDLDKAREDFNRAKKECEEAAASAYSTKIAEAESAKISMIKEAKEELASQKKSQEEELTKQKNELDKLSGDLDEKEAGLIEREEKIYEVENDLKDRERKLKEGWIDLNKELEALNDKRSSVRNLAKALED